MTWMRPAIQRRWWSKDEAWRLLQMLGYSVPTEWNLLQFRPFNWFRPLNWVRRAAGGYTRPHAIGIRMDAAPVPHAAKKEIRTKLLRFLDALLKNRGVQAAIWIGKDFPT